MQSLTIKQKKGNDWVVLPHTASNTTADMLRRLKRCVLEYRDGDRLIYAVTDDNLRGAWCRDKMIMPWEDFAKYWQVKLFEHAIDVFSRQPNDKPEQPKVETVTINLNLWD